MTEQVAHLGERNPTLDQPGGVLVPQVVPVQVDAAEALLLTIRSGRSSRCTMWPVCGKQIRNVGSEACRGPIVECQDATAHLADYLAGSLPVEEVEAFLTHAAACAACRDS